MLIDIILIIILIICVITDIRSRKIYNKVIYPALFATFIYYAISGGWAAFSHSLIGFLIGFGLLLIPYFMGGMGAGDVKLLGLIGAIKGGAFVFQAFLYTAIIGGIMALAIILFGKGMGKSLMYHFIHVRNGVPGGAIPQSSLTAAYPYGVAIALGTFVGLLLQGWSFV